MALKSQGERSAYPAGGSGLPILVAKGTSGCVAALGTAAYRDEACRESTVGVENKSGWFAPQSMDSVVAPYQRLLALEHLVDMVVEYSPERSLSAPTKG